MNLGKYLPRLLPVAAAVLIIVASPARAQDPTGTMRGTVTDLETGEPLASVIIRLQHPEGTGIDLGTVTDPQGAYVLLNIPAGRYGLKVTMMGYTDMTLQDLAVTAGGVIRQHFQMARTVMKPGGEGDVPVPAEMIDRRVTHQEQSYTIEEIERMPVTSTTDIVALQSNIYRMTGLGEMIPGYRDRGLEQIHVRGGRNAEVAFMIDGLQATNLIFGVQAAPVDILSLSEMVIMTGGMTAEYGNAMSGVVNMITREGGVRSSGSLQVDTSALSRQPQDDVRRSTSLNTYYGGPVPYAGEVMSFFLSGATRQGADYISQRDRNVFHHDINPYDPSAYRPEIDYRGVDDPDNFSRLEKGDDPYLQYEAARPWLQLHPLDVYSGWLGYGYDNQWNGMLNLTARWSPSIKLTVSGHRADRSAIPYTHHWRMAMQWGFPEWLQDYLKWGGLRYDAADYTDYHSSIIAGTGATGWHNEKNVLRIDNRRLSLVFQHQVSPSTHYSVRGVYHGYDRTMRVDRWINEEGWVARREYAYPIGERDTTYRFTDEMTRITLGQFGYSSGIRDADAMYDMSVYDRGYGYIAMHGAGLGYTGSDRYYTDHRDITRSIKADVTSQVTVHHQVKTGFQYNALTLDQYNLQLLYLDPPYFKDYRRSPWEFAAYLQTRYAYEELVVNIGLRFEAFCVGKLPYWISPLDPIDRLTGQVIMNPHDAWWAPQLAGAVERSLAPRLGVSHPLTEQAGIYFNYGHYYQNPVYRNLFLQGKLYDSVPLIGNPTMDQERTVAYEFGFSHTFTRDLALTSALWVRDSTNLVGSVWVPSWFQERANPYSYTVFLNRDYSTSRGMDIALRKRFADNWSGRLYYTTMAGEGNQDDPWGGYREGSAGGALGERPSRARPLGWSQPHRFSLDLYLALPQGYGPALAGIRPYERMGVSLLFQAASGRPYTPATAEGPRAPYSAWMPWTFSLDGRFHKDLTLLGRHVSVFALVSNMLDRRNVLTVYSRTGRADDPGPEVTGYSDSYDRFHHFTPPRRIDIGIRVFY